MATLSSLASIAPVFFSQIFVLRLKPKNNLFRGGIEKRMTKRQCFHSNGGKYKIVLIHDDHPPDPSVSKRSKASRISCLCSSVSSGTEFFLPAAENFLDD